MRLMVRLQYYAQFNATYIPDIINVTGGEKTAALTSTRSRTIRAFCPSPPIARPSLLSMAASMPLATQ